MQRNWDEHWKATDCSHDGSWPDVRARMLELEFIYEHFVSVKDEVSTVLELGCGPYTLMELPALHAAIAKKQYVGIDISETALKTAALRAPGGQLIQQDLNNVGYLPQAEFVIVRRTLQNLTGRRWLEKLGLRKHGVVIEGSNEALHVTNKVRMASGLGIIPPPPFNAYLNSDEAAELDSFAKREHFLSLYYFLTRGCQDLRDWYSDKHLAAYNAQLEAGWSGCGTLGPVVGWRW